MSGDAPESRGGKKSCFVIMGYGKKTDYRTGRVLDLDASYRNLIKPAVEDAGLECIRADEMVFSGLIDLPMYEQLLNADVVVADLSTYIPNTFYELGVRHALKPHTTIIIAEDQLQYPFYVNSIVIRRYKHLGEDIGYSEMVRFKKELSEALKKALDNPQVDSPVYTYLKRLTAPTLGGPDPQDAPPPDAEDEHEEEEVKPVVAPAPARDLIFFSYSHNNESDKMILDKIQHRLRPLFEDQTVRMWDDRQIKPGQDWEKEIKNALARAKGAVLIVSNDFLNSEFITEKELPVILNGVGEADIMLMWVATEKAFVSKKISKYQALHNAGETLDSFSGKALNDKIFEICEKIKALIFPDSN